jgi:hypothetical protein
MAPKQHGIGFFRGYYLTFAEQWDDLSAIVTLRQRYRVGPLNTTHGNATGNRRVAVLLRKDW